MTAGCHGNAAYTPEPEASHTAANTREEPQCEEEQNVVEETSTNEAAAGVALSKSGESDRDLELTKGDVKENPNKGDKTHRRNVSTVSVTRDTAVLIGMHKAQQSSTLTSGNSESSGAAESADVPWLRVAFALLLSVIGVAFVAVGVLILAQVVEFRRLYSLAPYGLVLFGILCLVPGVYHVLLALRAATGHRGATWDDLRR